MAEIPLRQNEQRPLPNDSVGEEKPDPRLIVDDINSKLRKTPDSSPIPDGGLVAWIQCAGSFVLFFNGFGLINTFGRL